MEIKNNPSFMPLVVITYFKDETEVKGERGGEGGGDNYMFL